MTKQRVLDLGFEQEDKDIEWFARDVQFSRWQDHRLNVSVDVYLYGSLLGTIKTRHEIGQYRPVWSVDYEGKTYSSEDHQELVRLLVTLAKPTMELPENL